MGAITALIDLTIALRILAIFLVPLGLLDRATDTSNVEYQDSDGTTLHAYLATPPDFDPTAEYPAAIVLHAWNGLAEEPQYFSDLLAEQGYVAIAPDLFRNVASANTNIVWNILTVALTPQHRMDGDIDAALDYLTNTVVNTSQIFSGPGFCFGGAQVLELSSRQQMFATITLYGANAGDFGANPDDDDLWGFIGADGDPVLGIYGEEDGNPTPEDARSFESALIARNISHTVTIYDGVGHAFVNPEDHPDNETQAVEAWDQVVNFMEATLNGRGTSTRRASELGVLPPRSKKSHSVSLRRLFDHAMDWFKGKGHFSHRHYKRTKHGVRVDVKKPQKTLSGASVHYPTTSEGSEGTEKMST